MSTSRMTGGCQCGAVRYELLAAPDHVGICHCSMCRRATGQAFMTDVRVQLNEIKWLTGKPITFRSSNIAERGFCARCGTPLTYSRDGSGKISVMLGSLDDPTAVVPQDQFGVESKLPWTDHVSDLPGTRTEQWMQDNKIGSIESRQSRGK